MAQLVIAAAGAALGGFIAPGIVAFGMTGASLGWMAGSMLGSAFAPTQKSSGPQLSDLSVSTSAFGTPIPYVQGHPRIAGQIVWASTKREIATTEEVGKGGGGAEYTSFTYEVDLLILLTDNEIEGVRRVWSNGELVYDGATEKEGLWTRITSYTGAPSQLPDPTYEAAVSTANAPAYRGRGSVFIQALQLGGSGQIPNLTFEIGTQVNVVYADVKGGASFVTTADANQTFIATILASQFVPFYTRETAAFTGVRYIEVEIDATSSARGWFFGAVRRSGWSDSTKYPGNPYGPTSLYAITNLNYFGGTPATITAGVSVANPSFNADWTGRFGISIDNGTGVIRVYKAGSLIQTWTTAFNDFDFWFCVYGANKTYSGTIYRPPANWVSDPGGVLPIRVANQPSTLVEQTIASVVTRLCTVAGLASVQFDTTALSAITRPVRSMAISSVSSARTVLDMLAQSYHFEAVLSDKIYFRPRASAPAATLTFNELGVIVDSGTSPEPLPLTQANELEIPAQMALTYSNVDGDYQTDTQYSDRLLTGQESTSAMQVPLGFTSTEAKQIVDAMLLDKAVSALTTSVSLGLTRAALEPTDVVLLTGEDGSSYRMRIVKKAEASGVTTLECVQDDSTVFTQTGTTAGGTASQTTVLATPTTNLELLDVPLLRDADNAPGHYLAVSGSASNWSGCAIFDSADNLTYSQKIYIGGGAVMGTCTTTLGSWTGGNFADETNSLTVDVGAGQLTSTTHEGMLSSVYTNAALVGDEIIQFREAALVSAGVYTLRGLLRGKRGTEAKISSHASGERFVVLSNAGLRFITRQTSDIGKLVYYKAVNAGQKLSAATAKSLTPLANVLKPLTPVNIRYAARADGGIDITWDRRTRLSENWLIGVLPLGESTEAYEIDVYISGVFKRKLFSTSPAAIYSYPMFYSDAGYSGAALSLVSAKVFQVSTVVGLGSGVSATPPSGTSLVDDSGITSTTLYKRPGIGFVYDNNALVFEVVKRIEGYKFDTSAAYKVFESTDGGSNFTQRATLNAPVSLDTSHWAYRASDGVYITMPIEKREATANPSIAITFGVFGSDPVVTNSVWTRPYLPVVMGCNGTTFLIITEGNKSFTSADGVTWTDNGFMTGLPFALSTQLASFGFAANVYSPGLTYLSGKWYFYAAAMGLFATADPIGLTGWTRAENFPVLPNGPTGLPQYYALRLDSTNKITLNSGALFAVGQRIIPQNTGPNASYLTNQCVFKSTDNAATWTVAFETETNAPVFGSIAAKAGVLFVYPSTFGTWFYHSSDNGSTWTQGTSNLTNPSGIGAYPGTSKLLVADYNLGATAPEIAPTLFKASSDGFTFTLSNGIT